MLENREGRNVPQVFINGDLIGGAEDLEHYMSRHAKNAA